MPAKGQPSPWRGQPLPWADKVRVANRTRTRLPEEQQRRSAGLRRAHAEGRMPRIDNTGLRGEETSQWKGDEVKYRAAHKRLVGERGAAADHDCVDCGRPAQEWSLDRDRAEVLLTSAEGFPYSTNVEDYDPRCRRCHIRFDRRGTACTA